jgi:glycosyltransferase involved in cell wall biosynthesis
MTSYLFVHQNFPGQFPHVAHALAERGDTVVAIGDARRLKCRTSPHPRIRIVGYPEPKGSNVQTHHYLRDLEAHTRRGQAAFRVALELRKQGFNPDVIVAHPGWGETLFLRDAFPRARIIHYLEFFYRVSGADVGFDPEFPISVDDVCRVRMKNATQLLGFEAADAGISPTLWQKSRYPADWQSRIVQLHDGINTTRACPNPNASVNVGGNPSGTTTHQLTRSDEVITYVARNLEPYRGFHSLMRMLPTLLELRPAARVLIVGGDDVSYGRRLPQGVCYREHYLQQWGNDVDRSRVHFLGRLSYDDYLKVLQVSSLHIYLTYPFVLSWSMLEAMSAGCLVLGSDTAPVREVINHSENGFLADFFDTEALARRSAELLASRRDLQAIRQAARDTMLARYDLHGRCLSQLLDFLADKSHR